VLASAAMTCGVSAARAWDGIVTAGLIRKLLNRRKYSLGISLSPILEQQGVSMDRLV